MRLSSSQCAAVKAVIQQSLGVNSMVWLFGSRVSDLSRGGDIDLYIEPEKSCGIKEKLRLMTKIQMIVGLRKIDLIVKTDASNSRSIYETAKSEGVRL